MEITFWGVRGSIPTPITTKQIKEKLLFLFQQKNPEDFSDSSKLEEFINNISPIEFGSIGGNTSCVEVRSGSETFILDMGSGMKPLGMQIMQNKHKYSEEFHIFLSHTHWDHISGLPFFPQAHSNNCSLKFYSPHENLKLRLEYQQDHRFFPVGFELLKAKKSFYRLREEPLIINETEISYLLLNHPGKSYSYKLKNKDKTLVYMTDLYFSQPSPDLISFCKDADLLIFDSQFSTEEIVKKRDYGHCTGETGVDLANAANVKRLALFHHDPDKTDSAIKSNFLKVKKYNNDTYPLNELEILLSYEGLTINL